MEEDLEILRRLLWGDVEGKAALERIEAEYDRVVQRGKEATSLALMRGHQVSRLQGCEAQVERLQQQLGEAEAQNDRLALTVQNLKAAIRNLDRRIIELTARGDR